MLIHIALIICCVLSVEWIIQFNFKSILVSLTESNNIRKKKEVSEYTSLSESTIRRDIQKGVLKSSNKTGRLLSNSAMIEKKLEDVIYFDFYEQL